MSPKKLKIGKEWSLHPSLHDDVSRLLEADGLYFEFHNVDDDISCTKEHDTNITGLFLCPNRTCSAGGWSSKHIAVTIRMYTGTRYNAKVYHQRCETCETLGRPLLNESYAERVVYRLKKWSGIQMEPPPFSGKSNRPHNRKLCEGCKAGHCKVQDPDLVLTNI
ncbi:conserved hypothetical protein [Microsporum canis CBS 113480]|uniref:3CxxC-type domain-containing protein n=1 Tax=Arthroderma otae (strain ATCC MYA-4605 / CBS 113480) TaxID=554155 RepID=C5FNC1_ARTOC|nr:conserved hypothetical protein [Microsporum canis CBS 113480]EEQ31357.1 conserved hypothetical protein [Microsporum canis CBS 113480]